MKKLFILFAFVLFITSCGDDSGGSSDTSFRIKAGTLTKFSSPTGLGGTAGGNTYNYAIIFNKTIDGTNYVGIALSDDPESETNNLKIYYQSNTISNITLIGGTSPGFRVIYNGGEITGTGTYVFTFTPTPVGTYTTYLITISTALTANFTALYVP